MGETARRVMKSWLSWEILRIVYNAVLLAEGLIPLWLMRIHLKTDYHGFWPGWDIIVLLGLAANACYCIGPLAEIAYAALGPRPGLRVRAYLAGTSGVAPEAAEQAARFVGQQMEIARTRGRYFLFAAGLLFSMAIVFSAVMRMYSEVSGWLH